MKVLSVILVGAGGRGVTYVSTMKEMPDKFKIIGVAEPLEGRRKMIQQMFDLPDENCYSSWEEILRRPKFADLAVIGTQDNMHYAPAMMAIEQGYNLLLEKPIAPTQQECADIALAATKKGVSVLVCHVLRYTPFYKTIKKALMDGMIGEVMTAMFEEGVGHVHNSHSFIRGDWHDEKVCAPMILAKCCHDMDIIQWLLDKKCKKVTSFGKRAYFIPENAPEGAPVRCADGGCPVADECPYNCKKVYFNLSEADQWYRRSAAKGVAAGWFPTDEEMMETLRTTDYGLCVFHANQTVVDRQVVNLEFEDGVAVNFNMNPFNQGGRYIRLFGTKGELYAFAHDTEITVFSFADGQIHKLPVVKTEETIAGGHGGGDGGIVEEL